MFFGLSAMGERECRRLPATAEVADGIFHHIPVDSPFPLSP